MVSSGQNLPYIAPRQYSLFGGMIGVVVCHNLLDLCVCIKERTCIYRKLQTCNVNPSLSVLVLKLSIIHIISPEQTFTCTCNTVTNLHRHTSINRCKFTIKWHGTRKLEWTLVRKLQQGTCHIWLSLMQSHKTRQEVCLSPTVHTYNVQYILVHAFGYHSYLLYPTVQG